MQLKNTQVKTRLFAASCALLGGSTVHAEPWDIETAIMYYSETDRVQALEGIFQGKKSFSNEREFSAKLVLDSLTGASANGAVAQDGIQTFTSPSGNAQYSASAGETPLDDTFLDTRVQLSSQWSQPLGENYTVSGGLNASNEYDYRSLSFNASIGRFLDRKNTMLSLGFSYAADSIEAVGGQPLGLAEMVIDRGQFANQAAFDEAFGATRDKGAESKNTFDAILGVTQVISRRWISQFNVSISSVDGYQSDPYKILSVVDSSGIAQSYRYEKRPDMRSKQSFYAQSKYHFDSSIWDLSLRVSDDDWGIQSTTLETRYKILLGGNDYLEPHLRFYQQSEADFYQPFLTTDSLLPEFASADYRIGKLNAFTVGMKYGKKLSQGREFGVRLEYYNQAPQDVGVELPGELQNQDIYPSLDAVILQFDYKF